MSVTILLQTDFIMFKPLAAMLPRRNEALPPSFVFAIQRQQSAPILGDCKGAISNSKQVKYFGKY